MLFALPILCFAADLQVSPEGQPLLFLLDEQGETVSKVPSAHEQHGRLYFGNLATDFVSYIELDQLDSFKRGGGAG
jgi:hypothetical protein